jgi:hypothetical protein
MREIDPGFTSAEGKMIEQAWLYAKMADDLRAKASKSRYLREHPEAKGKEG